MRLPFCVLIHSLLLREAAQGYNGCSRASLIMADALCHSLRTRLGIKGVWFKAKGGRDYCAGTATSAVSATSGVLVSVCMFSSK